MDILQNKRTAYPKLTRALLVMLVSIVVTLAFCAHAQKAYAQDRADRIDARALSPISINDGKWLYGSKGWWYQRADGSYPANTWAVIANKIYHFDAAGWMSAQWLKIGDAWYYLGSDGALKTGWQKVKGLWYYLGQNAAMVTGKQVIDGETYFLASSGAMKIGWNKEGTQWFYYRSSGAMARGWVKDANRWYYLSSNGVMQTGKPTIDGKRYFFADSGAMLTGWLHESTGWHYYGSSGAMYEYQWKGDYYLGRKGIMATDAWVDSGRYYVGSDGKWVPHKLVVYSANGYVYHIVDSCPQANKIKEPLLMSHSVAKSKGYTLCKNCQVRCEQ